MEKATPSGEHGRAQAAVIGALHPPFQRKPGGGRPGGWWILSEVEVQLSTGDVVRPDVLGFRRERCPECPAGSPVTVRPDWICEVVSPANASSDTVKKVRLYHQVGLPHYWLVDTRAATLTGMHFSDAGFVTVLRLLVVEGFDFHGARTEQSRKAGLAAPVSPGSPDGARRNGEHVSELHRTGDERDDPAISSLEGDERAGIQSEPAHPLRFPLGSRPRARSAARRSREVRGPPDSASSARSARAR